jgi:hypothetical protein
MALTFLEQQLEDQKNAFNKIIAKFEQSKIDFEETATNPGSGFDLDQWLNLLPSIGLRSASIDITADPSSYFANDTDPSVAPPELLTPEAISTLAEGAYDSAYLLSMENEIRALTADIIVAVLPAGLYDEYFRQGNLKRARDTRDDIDTIKERHGRRGWPSAPMTLAREVGDRVGKWQEDSYANQNTAATERLGLATELYFSSIKSGQQIEALRSRVILDYSKMYSNQNKVLVGYYDQLVAEKTAEAQLLLDNIRSDLNQAYANIDAIAQDNAEEVELPETIFRRALTRLDIEFDIDGELLDRKQGSMQYITNLYGTWLTAVVGTNQSTISAKHDVTAE